MTLPQSFLKVCAELCRDCSSSGHIRNFHKYVIDKIYFQKHCPLLFLDLMHVPDLNMITELDDGSVMLQVSPSKGRS